MKRRAAELFIAFSCLMLIAVLSLVMFYAVRVSGRSASSERIENTSFKPSMWRPDLIDKDSNGIADSLDQEIGERLSSNAAQEYVNVTVMLKSEPTASDEDAFISCGGYLTTSPWTQAIYGFGGLIPYSGITNFTQKCPNLLLIEEQAKCDWNIAYAAKQVGARPYVWNTLGLQGDPNSSVAIIDTGIDASQPDFSPGYGNQSFSEKIVGWNDQIGTSTSPYDDSGHGSHVSGLAAGDGFFSTDASGNAVATWGSNLGPVLSSGTYLISGMMVNKTGTITIKVKWATTGSATLSALPLFYGDETLSAGSWTQVASVSTPSQNTWYTLTYNVPATPLGGYDMYHVLMTLTAGTGNLSAVFTMSWPYTPPSDGFSAWTGIAPQAKLVGVKVLDYSGNGTSTGLISGINWIIANRMNYHITVASMSLGFSSEVAAVDSAVVNLVNSGVTTVVAAGNSGPGSNYIYTPGSVDEVITVAAMNQFDDVASYSSEGGTSRYTGNTTKPDITAPGGSFYGVPLFSADSNYNDAEGGFTDVQANDSAPMQGTSMATPIVAGAVDIVEQAMGGYSVWNWTRSQALLPKMILLMTATETYPNLREGGNSSTSPTLDRGGKDVHEGYGRLNLDAAADAVLKTYQIGTSVSDTLGMPPTLANISVLGQRLAWARNVQLVSGFKYNFTLSVPAGADYDLYLYNSTGTTYGEPAAVASSTRAIATGGTETFNVTAPYTGTYYVVVKRASENLGSGNFTLTSSGPVLVNLDTLGLTNATNVVHYTQNSTSKNGSIVSNRFSDYVDTGTTLRIDNPIYALTTQRYTTSDPISFTIQSSANFTARYTEQFWIQVESPHDLPSSSQWVNRGSDLEVNVTSPADDDGMGTRYRCTGYTLDGNQTITDGSTSYSFANVQNTHDVTFNWIAQYRLTVFSDHDSPAPTGSDNWYDTGSLTNASVTSPADTVGGTRYRCIGWTGVGSAPASGTETSTTFTMTQPSSITWNWIAQHMITFAQTNVDSDFTGAVVTIDTVNYDRFGVSFWWDNNSIHSFSFQSPLVVTKSVKRYSWKDTTGLSTTQSNSSFQVTQPGIITGDYNIQFNVVFAQTNVDSDFTGAVVTIDTVDYPASAFPMQFWWENGTFHSFSFYSPLVINDTKSYDWVSTTGLSTLQAETLLITKSGNVTGDYFVHIRYEITFSQSGVDVDFPSAVVTIDGLNYTAGGLPVMFLWDANSSHTFLYDSPISDGGTREFIWVSTNGLSALEEGYIRATVSGDIIGNFKRKPTLTMNPTNRTCRKYGEAFTVAVTVSDEYDVGGFEFEIHYNTTLLDYVSVNWSARGSGTVNVDETDGIVTGTTLGPAISGNETLMTLEFKTAYYHIWKDENATQGWVNDLKGAISLESASLTYTDGAILHYAKNGIDEINVGPDFAYTFSPIRGDLDNNGQVDLTDLRIVAAFFDSSNEEYNLAGNTTIDIFDLVVVASNYGYTYTPP